MNRFTSIYYILKKQYKSILSRKKSPVFLRIKSKICDLLHILGNIRSFIHLKNKLLRFN